MEGLPQEEEINRLVENHAPAFLVLCALDMGEAQPMKASLMVLVGTPQQIHIEIKDDPLGRIENTVRTSFAKSIFTYRLLPLWEAQRINGRLKEIGFELSNPQDIFDL